jgi:SAM-dependent methyltransferase
MKTAWDYTPLADAYVRRPDYSETAVDEILATAEAGPGSRVCDVGAGVGHLTRMLADRGLEVVAVEPNDAMRTRGIERTRNLSSVDWAEGVGEDTRQPDGHFDLVTFGSSFNVVDRRRALIESHRILKPGGWFACLWNHRDLEDPVQAGIEAIIRRNVSAYSYGSRREDQQSIIEESGLFGPVRRIEGRVVHRQSRADCVEAWRSHATLQRQAGPKFLDVVREIEGFLLQRGGDDLAVPYTTRAWMARRLD